jgi:hypothetical protein
MQGITCDALHELRPVQHCLNDTFAAHSAPFETTKRQVARETDHSNIGTREQFIAEVLPKPREHLTITGQPVDEAACLASAIAPSIRLVALASLFRRRELRPAWPRTRLPAIYASASLQN